MHSWPKDNFPGLIAQMLNRTEEGERRGRSKRLEGWIIDAKPEEGLYKVRFHEQEGDDAPFDGPWMRVKPVSSGGLKIMAEPTIGQAVEVFSQSGDLTDGVIELSTFFDDEPRPHNKNGELAITVGGYRMVLDAGGNEVTRAVSRNHDTDGDVVFKTGGVVRFE